MSNKYEREIEEILRNIEDARPSVGERIRAMNRRPPTRLRSGRPRFGLEARYVTGIALLFLAATVRWIVQVPDGVTGLVILGLGLAGFAVLVATVVIAWVGPGGARPEWRANPLSERGGGGSRGPFSSVATRWNLLKLRLRYRRDR